MNYTMEWKRTAFFRFIEHFQGDAMNQTLKAKVLQAVIIPCFAVSFDRGQKIVGGPPTPYQDSPDNVVSVFISNVSFTWSILIFSSCFFSVWQVALVWLELNLVPGIDHVQSSFIE